MAHAILIGGHARSPIVVSVPHAGRDYPAGLEPRLRVPLAQAVALEDRYVDRLVDASEAGPHRVIVARTPRLWIDLNRGTDDREQAMRATYDQSDRESPRARSGLGIVPTRLPGAGALWQRLPSASEVDARIAAVHAPYHDAVTAGLAVARDRWTCAVLVDLHSMPSLPGRGAAHVVIGDRHGESADSWVTDTAVAACCSAGLRVIRNMPYAGGHIVERHGHPSRNVHAIQVEFDRGLYLDRRHDQPGEGLPWLSLVFADLLDMLAAEALARLPAQAAE